jgi:hypothetical protein
MARMQAVYYRDAQGREPVSEFIDALKPMAAQVAVDNRIDRLNVLEHSDPPLAFPHTSQVEGELRELRCHYGRRLFRSSTAGQSGCSCSCTSSRRRPVRSPGRTKPSPVIGGRTSAAGWTNGPDVRRVQQDTTLRDRPRGRTALAKLVTWRS